MWRLTTLSLLALLCLAPNASAVEEPAYRVVAAFPDFEVRDYPAYLVAETLVSGSFEESGNAAFKRLFAYISGDNIGRTKIEMTAPVRQGGQRIDMASPVIQKNARGSFIVQFVMPSKWTKDTIPIPTDKGVAIKEVPAARLAAIRYSGFWSEKGYRKHLMLLENAVTRENLKPSGSPIWARYDPPFVPWFLRRNEVMIPISANDR